MSKHSHHTTADTSLHQLLRCAAGGDQQAFASLLSRYTPLLEARLQRIRTPQMTEEDVKDLRQEAYVSFYRALMHYDDTQSAVDFGLYAKVCIDNGLYSALRSMKHLRVAPVLPLDEMEEQPDTGTTDPSARLIEQEKFNQLYALIERTLSPMENRVWQMYITGQTSAA
ncbi:MAG: sigma-70 family RNA polymerase sigma factor, partial [Clostridia bacterium]|nr:sigma-70 family RNA polymerase sigma factor [Clostridia bacterium]